jgi:hypothetical protein
MFDFLIGIVVSLLPAPYREWWNERLEAAMVSGLFEMVGSVTLLFARYIQFISQSMASMSQFGIGVHSVTGETGVMGLGLFLLLRYLASPITLLLLFFFIEGLARALDPVINQRVLPSFVFYSVDWIIRDLRRTFLSRSHSRTS